MVLTEREKQLTKAFMRMLIESRKGNSVNEITYKEWSTDENSTYKKKINMAIHEVSKNLYMIERVLHRSSKLKTEVGANQDVFWKSTQTKFTKINERLLKLSHKIMELNK